MRRNQPRGAFVGFALAAMVLVLILGWALSVSNDTEPVEPEDLNEPGDAPFDVDLSTLDAAVDCDSFTHPDTEPVLLVHGTSVGGHQQWDENYVPFLRESGRDVCILTYPDRGFGDMQTSAEYVARAVQRIHSQSGRSVDMVGHSQGALMPRWAIKFWPSVRAAVDDFVMLAGPQHGTDVASDVLGETDTQSSVTFQLAADSDFLAALNAGDETPGTIDYTSIFTLFDQIVRPLDPPTAALAVDDGDTRVVNIPIQQICPDRYVDHGTIGTTDTITMRLVLDALDNDGPADIARAGIDESDCSEPDRFEASPPSGKVSLPELHLTTSEPPLRDYVSRITDSDSDGDGGWGAN